MTNKIHLLFNECSDVFKRCNDETMTPSGSFPIGTAEINIHTYIMPQVCLLLVHLFSSLLTYDLLCKKLKGVF